MKKFLLSMMVLSVLFSIPAAAQKQKETRAQKKARIEKLVKESIAANNYFVEVSRICPQNGVAQNVIYGNDGYYMSLQGSSFSCNLAYIGGSRNVAYHLNNLNISCKNQNITLFGGWQEKEKSYIYKIVFWNGDVKDSTEALQVTMTYQIFLTGEVLAKVDVPDMDSMSYVGEIAQRPEAE